MKANERLAASQTAHSLGSCSVSENKRREKGSYTGSCTASCARGRRQLHGQPGSAYSPLPLTLPFRSPNLKQLRKARSRLYRSRFLQENTHVALFFEIYMIYAHRSKLLLKSSKFNNLFDKTLTNMCLSTSILINTLQVLAVCRPNIENNV